MILIQGMSTSDIIPGGDIGLSHYTPSLSRRIQPEANRRLLRTMSTREERPPPTPRRTGSSCVLPPLPRASTRRLPSADISSLHSSSSLSSVRSNSALNTRLRSDYDRSANSGDVSSTKAPKETLYPRTIERLEVPNPDENRESSYHLSANNRITNLTHSNSSINELLDDRKSHRSRIPSLLQFHRSSSLTRNEGKQKVNPDCVRGEDSSLRNTPDRSVLSKFFRQNSDEKSKSFIRSKSGAANDNTGSESTEALKKKSRKISRFLRPDFFDTPREESVYVKEKEAQKSAEAEAKKAKRIARRAALLEKRENNTSNPPEKLVNAGVDVSTSAKQCGSQTNVNVLDKSEQISDSKIAENGKNKFLHTLERKLEKLRSYGNDSLVPSRVEQAINSLQKQCGGNLAPSESMLLKRAVSVDDVAGTVSGGPVSNVLGLLRRIEGGPRARRTQSVYAGATSDTALLNQHEKLDKASLQSPNNGGSAIVNNSKLKQEGIENRDHLEKSLFENLTQSGKDVSLKDEESVIVPRLNCLNIKSSPSKPVNGEAIRLSEKAENDIKSQDLSQLKENNIKKSVACKENDKSVSNESKIKYEKRNCNGNNKRDESSIHNTKDIVEKGSKNFSRMENVKQNDFPEKESTLQIDTIRKKTEDQKVLNSLDAKYSSLVDSSMKNNGNNGNTQLLVNVNNTDPLRECAIAVQNPRELHLPLNKSNIPLSHDNTKKLDLSPLEDSFSVVSPVDESESIDSWSVCSDLDNRDLSASSFNKTPSPIFEDETVEERIRRKSFYTRFNDSKRKGHRKSSGGLSLGQRKTSLSDLNLGANPKKTVRSQSLYEPDYLDYSTYRRKSPVPSRSSSNVVNDFNTLPHSANALENGHGGIFYEYPEFQDSLSSNSLQESDLRNILASDDKQGYLCENRPGLGTFGRAGHLLRPTDFTSEILRRDPTAGYRSRLPTPTRVLRGESSFLDGKYNRYGVSQLTLSATVESTTKTEKLTTFLNLKLLLVDADHLIKLTINS